MGETWVDGAILRPIKEHRTSRCSGGMTAFQGSSSHRRRGRSTVSCGVEWRMRVRGHELFDADHPQHFACFGCRVAFKQRGSGHPSESEPARPVSLPSLQGPDGAARPRLQGTAPARPLAVAEGRVASLLRGDLRGAGHGEGWPRRASRPAQPSSGVLGIAGFRGPRWSIAWVSCATIALQASKSADQDVAPDGRRSSWFWVQAPSARP